MNVQRKLPLEPPRVAAHVLVQRLDSIRLAIGCQALAVARRLPTAPPAPPPLQILAQVSAHGVVDPPETGLPLGFLRDLAQGARHVEFEISTAPAEWVERMRRWEVGWIAGWALPSDRLPSVFFVAIGAARHEPGATRREVATKGMEALARALAPPPWIPLVSSSREHAAAPIADPDGGALADVMARVERDLLLHALQAAEGNKSQAARSLRLSRQGLYRKLRRHGLLRVDARALDSRQGGD